MPFSGTFVADASRAEAANVMSNAQTREGTQAGASGKEAGREEGGDGGEGPGWRSVMRV